MFNINFLVSTIIESKGPTTTPPEALRIYFHFLFSLFHQLIYSHLKEQSKWVSKNMPLTISTHMQVDGMFHFYSSTFFNFNADIFSLFWI